jgi:hypothetical protein
LPKIDDVTVLLTDVVAVLLALVVSLCDTVLETDVVALPKLSN